MINPTQILSSHNYQRKLLAQYDSEAPGQIRVTNFSFPALVGADPWGRDEPHSQQIFKQPVLLSARVSLREPFSSASVTDTVDSSTIHYGNLSKEILKVVKKRNVDHAHFEADGYGYWSLNDLLDYLFVYLTGVVHVGSPSNFRDAEVEGGIPCLGRNAAYKPPLLQPKGLRELEFGVSLAKGTLMVDNTSLRKKLAFGANGEKYISSTLRLEGMRIPTLIGVNKNERTARQIVTASIELEPYLCKSRDCYPELAELVFKTIEESSFETLETLAIHVADRLGALFIDQYDPADDRGDWALPNDSSEQRSCTPITMKILLEKPTAVTFADAPAVEIVKTFAGQRDMARDLLKVPFPLTGRLDEWLACQSTDNT